MDYNEALEIMKHNSDGYCLWVGAGVSLHLAGFNGLPLWSDLVKELQAETTIEDLEGDYPSQLLQLLNSVGRTRFQRFLRENILEKLSKSIINQAKLYQNPDSCVPNPVRQIAHLGSLANPIVNFNIETFTSILLAGPGGPYEVKYFTPELPETIKGFVPRTSKSRAGMFRRHILHPHGAIDHSGICIMTASEYDSMNGTLAFQLAIHAAFSSNLVIMGMSLEDEYLRNQISDFRQQLRKVLWFVGSLSEKNREIRKWAINNKIEVIEIENWTSFWKSVESTLPGPNEIELLGTWRLLVNSSFYELSTSVITRALNNLPESTPEHIRQAYIQHRDNLGENPTMLEYTIEDIEKEGQLLAPIDEALKIARENLSS